MPGVQSKPVSVSCSREGSASPRDLVRGISGFYIWCLPIAALFVGLGWSAGRPWLWIAALVVMGAGCIVNARRCGRLHCYFSGPIFLLGALNVILSVARVVPLYPRTFLCVVLGLAALSCLLEFPLGHYARSR